MLQIMHLVKLVSCLVMDSIYCEPVMALRLVKDVPLLVDSVICSQGQVEAGFFLVAKDSSMYSTKKEGD
jgi:hypothetical protein